jgi:transposase
LKGGLGSLRKKDSYFQAQFRRLAGRRGKKRALIALARSLLEGIYHLLKEKTSFKDLGGDYFIGSTPGARCRILLHL